ncbi:hypothetical protein [Synechococcus sp. HK01-R]|uniref:hypothetical protein n=1 Tax=Synechococcus sp. HK01-R TaxID=2751171 RepID=UPI00162A490B|nr:hypothetical protein [Synechococcus sp. HK01-R]QNG27767.1 hypothetical protein H0O21_04045 [Synechococcus sp. HK01-R]
MTVLRQLDRFLLSSAFGKTLLGPIDTTGAAVLLGLPADPQPSPLLVGRITLVLLVVCGTWYGVRRSELERAASEARSRDFENRFEALIDEATDRVVERAERAEEAAVGALRSSLCGLEAQAAGADVAASTTARAYLALLEGEGLTVSPADPAAGSEAEEPLA